MKFEYIIDLQALIHPTTFTLFLLKLYHQDCSLCTFEIRKNVFISLHGNNGTVATLVCRRGAERESGVSIATTPRTVPLEMPNKGTQPSLKPQKRRTRRMKSNRRFNGYEGAPPRYGIYKIYKEPCCLAGRPKKAKG